MYVLNFTKFPLMKSISTAKAWRACENMKRCGRGVKIPSTAHFKWGRRRRNSINFMLPQSSKHINTENVSWYKHKANSQQEQNKKKSRNQNFIQAGKWKETRTLTKYKQLLRFDLREFR